MSKVRQFMNSYYKVYILAFSFLWVLAFFLPWSWQIGGVSIYYFIMKKLFVVFGVLSILYSILIKKSVFLSLESYFAWPSGSISFCTLAYCQHFWEIKR